MPSLSSEESVLVVCNNPRRSPIFLFPEALAYNGPLFAKESFTTTQEPLPTPDITFTPLRRYNLKKNSHDYIDTFHYHLTTVLEYSFCPRGHLTLKGFKDYEK